MWKKIGEYGLGFTGASYHTIWNELLDRCFVKVKEPVAKTILSNILYSGWSNAQRRPLINVMLVCPRGKTFIKPIYNSSAIKSGAYIADAFVNVIKEIGPQHVVQVIMDNAKNCKMQLF